MRRNELTAKATWNQVAVLHAGPAGDPLAVSDLPRTLAAHQSDANTETGQLDNSGRVRRIDQVQSKAEFFSVEINSRPKDTARQFDIYDTTA